MKEAKRRALEYLKNVPPAISGQAGHNRTFFTACKLVQGFGLNRNEALDLMRTYNRKCEPPWSEQELIHKVDDAIKAPNPYGHGYMLTKGKGYRKRAPLPQVKMKPFAVETPKVLIKINPAPLASNSGHPP